VECSTPAGATTGEMSTDPRAARLAARRASVMAVAGRVVDPLARLLGVKPEAFAPNNAWALTGRRRVGNALAIEKPEVVVATSPPPSALFAAANTVRGVPFIAEFRDLWAGGPYFDRGGPLLPALQRRMLARAGAVVTVTDGFRDRLVELHPEIESRLHVLPNGFDPLLLARRKRERSFGSPATLIHAGALYGDRTAVELLRALARPELASRTRLELVGVVAPETLRARETIRGINVSVEPPVTWETAIERTLAADIAVVINTPGTGGDVGQVPGKMYEVLALGRPILALMRRDSDAALLLERFGQEVGLAPPDDPEAIATAIERLLSDPPPPVPPEALAEFDRDRIAARYAALFDEVATRSRSATNSGTTASRR
jgi:glycosyltransferase involved in cell wall biosynthesis